MKSKAPTKRNYKNLHISCTTPISCRFYIHNSWISQLEYSRRSKSVFLLSSVCKHKPFLISNSCYVPMLTLSLRLPLSQSKTGSPNELIYRMLERLPYSIQC